MQYERIGVTYVFETRTVYTFNGFFSEIPSQLSRKVCFRLSLLLYRGECLGYVVSVDQLEQLSDSYWVLWAAPIVFGVDPRLYFADFRSDEFNAFVEHLRIIFDKGGDFFIILPRQSGVDRQAELSLEWL